MEGSSVVPIPFKGPQSRNLRKDKKISLNQRQESTMCPCSLKDGSANIKDSYCLRVQPPSPALRRPEFRATRNTLQTALHESYPFHTSPESWAEPPFTQTCVGKHLPLFLSGRFYQCIHHQRARLRHTGANKQLRRSEPAQAQALSHSYLGRQRREGLQLRSQGTAGHQGQFRKSKHICFRNR